MKKTILIILVLIFSGCSSPSYKQQKYARLPHFKEFEEDYEDVWNAALESVSAFKTIEVDKADGKIKTDWVYSTSNEKYFEYKVNGFPRKKYLQNRYKIDLSLKKQLGSTHVTADLEEQVEELDEFGSFKDWQTSKEKDLSKAHDIIENIDLKLNSRFKP